MPIGITGKRIIVTGGSKGIGAAAVREFAKEGANVVSFARGEAAGQKVAEEATARGPGSVTFRGMDVADREQVQQGVAAAVEELGGLDAFFNIAGIDRDSPVESMSEEEYDLVVDINLKGTFLTNQAAFPYLREAGGSIVNFGSNAMLNPNPMAMGHSHYAAAKGGVAAFTRTVAVEWGKHNIRVNCLVPAVWTPMLDDYRGRLNAEDLAQLDEDLKQMIPLGGKFGDPVTDLAPVLVFLASDASKFITGQIINVDGGKGHVR